MKRKMCIIIFILVIIGFIFIFTINRKDITIDINKLANDILQDSEFEDELNKIDDDIVVKLYDIDNAVSQEVYMSSGATSEELAIFEFRNEDDCKKAVEKVNERIENQKQNFKDYMPKEMIKLDNVIIKKVNKYLIVCVTDNREDVEKILNRYI